MTVFRLLRNLRNDRRLFVDLLAGHMAVLHDKNRTLRDVSFSSCLVRLCVALTSIFARIDQSLCH